VLINGFEKGILLRTLETKSKYKTFPTNPLRACSWTDEVRLQMLLNIQQVPVGRTHNNISRLTTIWLWSRVITSQSCFVRDCHYPKCHIRGVIMLSLFPKSLQSVSKWY